MTAPVVNLEAANPKDGCTGTGCRRQQTVQLHPYLGRRCPQHAVLPTIPPGPYQRSLALEMVDLGRADCAIAYLWAYLVRECDARFRRAVQAVTG